MFNFLSNKNHRMYVFTALTLLVLILGAFTYYFTFVVKEDEVVSSYDECVSTPGNRVTNNYPPQCITQDGQTFSKEVDPQTNLNNEIQVTNPAPNQVIESPIDIVGQATGAWLFEGQTSIKLYDTDNKLISEGIVKAQSDWTTDKLVPFLGTLTFDHQPDPQKGKLVIEKSNPSGIEANKKELEVPIYFK